MTDHLNIDMLSPEFAADPYPFFAQLRAEAPVQRVALPGGERFWLVTRYSDVETVFTDARFVKDWRHARAPGQSDQVPWEHEGLRIFTHNMLDRDPPDHTRLRALVSKAFTPRLIEQLRPRIQEIADDLLDAMQGRGEIDLIDAFAFPLPVTVIAELLGIPTADRERLRAWSDAATELSGSTSAERIEPEMKAFAAYLKALFELRRIEPRDDLVTGLLQAEEDGDRLSVDELLAMVFLLIVAGHETTVHLIGNGTLALLQHPDALSTLRQNPSLIGPAVEELLRYTGPVETSTGRYASEDVELGGVVIPRGDRVIAVIASADRDERRIADPDRLDITGGNHQHLAFGYGPHYCLGAPLARLEAQLALGTLIRRLPNLRLAVPPESLIWRPSMLIRGLRRLPVAID